MLVSRTWLNEWVQSTHNAQQLSDYLTQAGLEVATIDNRRQQLSKKYFVVGQVVQVQEKANSALRICQVDIGQARLRTIVCGAPNVVANMKTAVALPGAKIADTVIKNRIIAGVKSQGMLCSAEELGLEEKSSGILRLDAAAPVGQSMNQYLKLEDDILEIELTPNRGDCLSILGVAREVALQANRKLTPLKISKVRQRANKTLPIKLKAKQHCPRYLGRAIEQVDISVKTPDWIQERLRRCGLNPINPVVDITNYVMHQIGQPMHAFDLQKIDRGIVVRMAEKGEKLTLLDGKRITLTPDNLVIADNKKALALAGIMGGAYSAISDHTQDIYLEAAFFSPTTILGKARALGMHTDASHHYERGVDFNLPRQAIELATKMIVDICGGVASAISEACDKNALPKQSTIDFDKRAIKRALGISMTDAQVTRILEKLGMKLKTTKQGWRVSPPSWRFDISGQHDLIEELARCYGYHKIPSNRPNITAKSNAVASHCLPVSEIKNYLVNRGYYEAISYSFVDPKLQTHLLNKNNAIAIRNPISDNMAVMRQTLWSGLIEAATNNLRHQQNDIRLFEIGHVFTSIKQSLAAKEENKLGGLMSGDALPRQWTQTPREVDFYDLKGDIEGLLDLTTGRHNRIEFIPATHPALQIGQCATIHCAGKQVGILGKLSLTQQKFHKIDQAIFLFELDMQALSSRALPIFQSTSRYPAVQRDLAILVDKKIPVATIEKEICRVSGSLLVNILLFDIYSKNIENHDNYTKNIAFNLTFQSESSSLTSAEIDRLIDKVMLVLSTKYDAKMRDAV